MFKKDEELILVQFEDLTLDCTDEKEETNQKKTKWKNKQRKRTENNDKCIYDTKKKRKRFINIFLYIVIMIDSTVESLCTYIHCTKTEKDAG